MSNAEPQPNAPSEKRAWVQALGLVYIAATIASFFLLMDYEPGRGARGAGSAVAISMFGGIFLFQALFPDFFLFRLWVARYERWLGENTETYLRGAFVVVFLGSLGVGVMGLGS